MSLDPTAAAAAAVVATSEPEVELITLIRQ